MPQTSDRTSNPEGFGKHKPGQPDAPEEGNNRPGHDGQPNPDKETGKTDLADVEPGSDADEDPSAKENSK